MAFSNDSEPCTLLARQIQHVIFSHPCKYKTKTEHVNLMTPGFYVTFLENAEMSISKIVYS